MSRINRQNDDEAWRRSWIELLAYVDSLDERSELRFGPQKNIVKELLERVERKDGDFSH